MSDPHWLHEEEVLDIHRIVISRFGGSTAIRDRGLLLSAMDRPKNRFAHGETDLFLLAAYYAHGIGKNHPFVDGNKRVALTAAGVFLAKNGIVLTASNEAAVRMTLALVQDQCSVESFAQWLKDNAK